MVLRSLIHLQGLDPATGLYGQSISDIPFVCFWILLFTILRELVMRFFWTPIALSYGVNPRGKVLRFAEQGWSFVFYVISFSSGLYIMQTSRHANFNTAAFWDRYPYDRLPWVMKGYYLIQTGFWFQQLLVLNMEKKRKDYTEMLTHHFITITLMVLSYCCNITPVGNAILLTMDFCDILLPAAKMLRYASFPFLCDCTFGLFVVTWIISRHGIYLYLLHSATVEAAAMIPYGWDPSKGYFFNAPIHRVFSGLLIFLQVLLCGWSYHMYVAVKKALSGEGLEDVRSDDEDEDEGEEKPEAIKKSQRKVKKVKGE